VLVSFGKAKGACKWLNENFPSHRHHHQGADNFKLDTITDETRLLYKLFGLRNSYLKVWHTDTLTYYGEQMASGRQLPKSYEDMDDDPHQMGGNFILEFRRERKGFKIVYSYRSKIPPDRPSINELLRQVLDKF
jgi:hypothetical protein